MAAGPWWLVAQFPAPLTGRGFTMTGAVRAIRNGDPHARTEVVLRVGRRAHDPHRPPQALPPRSASPSPWPSRTPRAFSSPPSRPPPSTSPFRPSGGRGHLETLASRSIGARYGERAGPARSARDSGPPARVVRRGLGSAAVAIGAAPRARTESQEPLAPLRPLCEGTNSARSQSGCPLPPLLKIKHDNSGHLGAHLTTGRHTRLAPASESQKVGTHICRRPHRLHAFHPLARPHSEVQDPV